MNLRNLLRIGTTFLVGLKQLKSSGYYKFLCQLTSQKLYTFVTLHHCRMVDV